MRVAFPLYAKILGWFFLNLLAVAAVAVLLFDAQFHFNLDWFLSFGARERLEAARDLIVGELELHHPEDWAGVLARHSEAQRVRFTLADDDGAVIVGATDELPAEVVERIASRPTFPRFPRPPTEAPATENPGKVPAATPQPEATRRWPALRPPLRALMRTQEPTRYWLLASGRLDNPLAGPPFRVVVVAESPTLSAGGLVFDPKPWLWLLGGVIVFSLLFWLPLVRGITRTLARMMQATRQVADGRFDVRLQVRRRDELGALAGSIDQMASRLDGMVAGQKRFLGDVAHELCSPLARLQLALGVLEQRVKGDDAGFVKAAGEKAEQIAALVGELLAFSKASYGAKPVELQVVNVRELAEEAIRREQADGAELRLDVPVDLRALAEPDLLLRALANLVRNAIRHAGQAGPIAIRAARVGEEVAIAVADCGPGVPDAELQRIFDAFYRLDTARTRETGGTGLGLAIVKACIDSCSGTVVARQVAPHGLEVEIRLRGL
jgi:two-component system sensor histidine kinase CpxA